jgi:hypothetical protein
LIELIGAAPRWQRVYVDDAYALFARPDLDLPSLDRRGERLVGAFP